jgi:hypothetical protein
LLTIPRVRATNTLRDVDRQRLTSVLAAAAEHGARAHRTLTAAACALGIEASACH